MTEKLIIVLDCGATNVRAIAVKQNGEIIASHSIVNNTRADPYFEGGLIWDVEEIWAKLLSCTQHVLKQINKELVAAITVTTFGVDGAPLNNDGALLYPVISWACQRTAPIMENIDKYIPIEKLYAINGIHKFSFNTINKLIWFKENRPELLEQMKNYLFISSIFLQKLSGEMVTESTMAGTSMLTNCKTQNFSEDIFSAIGVENKFPKIVQSGEQIGITTVKVTEELGMPKAIPVIAAGHDTQFALFGSGANEGDVVLSSGTWEILMARTRQISTDTHAYNNGITNEFDAIASLYNSGVQWLGSGILEWLTNLLYQKEKSELSRDKLYSFIISEASRVEKSNLDFNLDFLNSNGSIRGLHINSKREEIYRAALQALSLKTAKNIKALEESLKFKAKSIIVVGGGSKNRLWNQVRADALNCPLKLIDKKETTVLGAALFAMVGVGIYKTVEEARNNVDYKTELVTKS